MQRSPFRCVSLDLTSRFLPPPSSPPRFQNYAAVMSVTEDLLCAFELLKPLDGPALRKEMTKSKRKRCVLSRSPALPCSLSRLLPLLPLRRSSSSCLAAFSNSTPRQLRPSHRQSRLAGSGPVPSVPTLRRPLPPRPQSQLANHPVSHDLHPCLHRPLVGSEP